MNTMAGHSIHSIRWHKMKITNSEEYDKAIKRIWEIFDAKPNTKEGEELIELVTAVEDYEEVNYPMGGHNE